MKTVTSVAVFRLYVMKYEKPTYLVNPEICMRNIRFMADKAKSSGVAFRPHFKTHQSHVIGRWFREEGISSITVSSVSSAAYFALDGWNDITIAFPLNVRELDAINHLASTIRLGLLFEDVEVALEVIRLLKHPADAWIKIDTGMGRTGMDPMAVTEIRRLADTISQSQLLRLKGLLTHAGHTYRATCAEEVNQIYKVSTGKLQSVRKSLLPDYSQLVLSYGDTPSCSLVKSFTDIDEIRPGNFIFYDMQQLLAGSCTFDQIAGIVMCPVVSIHKERNQAVIYGGAIHFSKDSLKVGERSVFGQMVQPEAQGWSGPVPGAYLISVSQEHGILEAPDTIIHQLKPGDIVGILPVHSCLTANLSKGYELMDGSKADCFSG